MLARSEQASSSPVRGTIIEFPVIVAKFSEYATAYRRISTILGTEKGQAALRILPSLRRITHLYGDDDAYYSRVDDIAYDHSSFTGEQVSTKEASARLRIIQKIESAFYPAAQIYENKFNENDSRESFPFHRKVRRTIFYFWKTQGNTAKEQATELCKYISHSLHMERLRLQCGTTDQQKKETHCDHELSSVQHPQDQNYEPPHFVHVFQDFIHNTPLAQIMSAVNTLEAREKKAFLYFLGYYEPNLGTKDFLKKHMGDGTFRLNLKKAMLSIVRHLQSTNLEQGTSQIDIYGLVSSLDEELTYRLNGRLLPINDHRVILLENNILADQEFLKTLTPRERQILSLSLQHDHGILLHGREQIAAQLGMGATTVSGIIARIRRMKYPDS